MAHKKKKSGLYCVEMYMTKEEYEQWSVEQKKSGLTESNYSREMNLLPPRFRGARYGNKNRSNAKKGKEKVTKPVTSSVNGNRDLLSRYYQQNKERSEEN